MIYAEEKSILDTDKEVQFDEARGEVGISHDQYTGLGASVG